jgi:hypothetical protein
LCSSSCSFLHPPFTSSSTFESEIILSTVLPCSLSLCFLCMILLCHHFCPQLGDAHLEFFHTSDYVLSRRPTKSPPTVSRLLS